MGVNLCWYFLETVLIAGSRDLTLKYALVGRDWFQTPKM
jgi:hypothetical protein